MKALTLAVLLVGVELLFGPAQFRSAAAVAEQGITGKWITKTVSVAQQMQKELQEARRNSQPQIDFDDTPRNQVDPDYPNQGPAGRGAPARGAVGARGRGNNFMPAGRQQTARGPERPSEPANEAFTPAITMELKADKTKVTGNIVVISPDDLSEEKLKAEDGTVSGKAFKFVTYKKVNNLRVPVYWQGELTSDNSLKIIRKVQSGKVVDEAGEVLFNRVK